MKFYLTLFVILAGIYACSTSEDTSAQNNSEIHYKDSLSFPIHIKGRLVDSECGWNISRGRIYIFQNNNNLLGYGQYHMTVHKQFNIRVPRQKIHGNLIDLIIKHSRCETDTIKNVSLLRDFDKSPLCLTMYCPSREGCESEIKIIIDE